MLKINSRFYTFFMLHIYLIFVLNYFSMKLASSNIHSDIRSVIPTRRFHNDFKFKNNNTIYCLSPCDQGESIARHNIGTIGNTQLIYNRYIMYF